MQHCSYLTQSRAASVCRWELVCVFDTCCFVTYQVLCCDDKEIVDVVNYIAAAASLGSVLPQDTP